MAITGSVGRESSTTSASPTSFGGHRRARLVLVTATAAAVLVFVVLTVGYLAEPDVVRTAGYAAAWWLSCLAVPVLGAAACAAGADPDDEGGYLGVLLDGLRAEWRR